MSLIHYILPLTKTSSKTLLLILQMHFSNFNNTEKAERPPAYSQILNFSCECQKDYIESVQFAQECVIPLKVYLDKHQPALLLRWPRP